MAAGRFWRATLDAALRPIRTPADDGAAAHRKEVTTSLIILLLPVFTLLAGASRRPLYVAAAATGLCSTVMTYVLWLAAPRVRAELFFIAGLLLALLLGDMHSINSSNRVWALGVLIMDYALVLDLEQWYTGVMLLCMLVYALAAHIDRTFTQFNRDLPAARIWLCDCGDPPCAQPVGTMFANCSLNFLVLLVDLYLTRGFASGMRHQVRIVQNTIEVAEEIAEQLSLYEVEEGRALLESERGMRLPDGMKSALHRLLDNLDEYRPYLPDAALVREDGEHPSVEAPGLGREEADVTLCFTDVQSSTELWEEFPQGMYSALQQHCSTIRRVAGRCSGYEVKVIGDAFMLAFKRAADACRFGLDVQEALLDAKWPSDVLQHRLCKPAAATTAAAASAAGGEVVWCGLRVRIGLHCGTVRVETNPVTGRCDYFGPPVNVAARVEASLQHGGLTGVTDAVLDAVTPAGLSQLGSPAAVELGARKLKGVGSPVSVTVLLSKRLAARVEVLRPERAEESESEPELRKPSSLGSLSSRSEAGSWQQPLRAAEPLLRERKATCGCFAGVPGAAVLSVRSGPAASGLGECVRDMLEAVEQAAVVTQGVLVGALSMRCFVVWNGPRSCADHCGQGLRATDYVWRLLSCLTAGLCSGDALIGNVSSGRKKHAMVIGGCVELSAALAEGAAASGEMGLTAGTFAQFCTTQQRTRRFAAWKVYFGEPLVLWALTAPRNNDDWRDYGSNMQAPRRVEMDGPEFAAVAERALLLGAGVELHTRDEY